MTVSREAGLASVAPSIRERALKKLAGKLVTQARQYAAEISNESQSDISQANLAKLRPALNRQRQTLMIAEPLLGLLDSSGGVPVEPVISHEIVGSVPNVAIPSAPPKPMQRFRRKLAGLAAGTRAAPLTILHIGKSTDGPTLFDQSLRSTLQKQFGDAGHGMIAPVRSYLQSDNAAYEISKAGRWRLDTNRVRSKVSFGLSAMRSTSRSSLSSMTLTSKTGPFDWVGVTIATGPSQGTFTMKVGDVERHFDAHADEAGSRYYKLAVQGSSATIQPGGGAQTAILNWSMGRNKAGIRHVYFDLLSDRPKEMQRLDANLAASDLRTLSPDLIMFDDMSSDDTVIREVSDLVAQISAASPQADIVHLGGDGVQLALQQTCLAGSPARQVKVPVTGSTDIKGVANWTWTPSRSDICAIEDQLQQGLVGADAANLTPDFADRRAAAFVAWLTKPSSKGGDVALLKAVK